MKRKINEENYNEQIKIGVAQDNFQAKSIVNMLKKEGINAYNKENIVFILVERDRNDPHYVDDVKQYAIKKFNEFCGNDGQPMKLACSKQKTMKLTESKLKSLIKESVRKALLENDDEQYRRDMQIQQWYKEDLQLCNELLNFLKKNGVKTAKIYTNRATPVVMVNTDEYYNLDIDSICDKFTKPRRMYATFQTYPATTYIVLNNL